MADKPYAACEIVYLDRESGDEETKIWNYPIVRVALIPITGLPYQREFEVDGKGRWTETTAP